MSTNFPTALDSYATLVDNVDTIDAEDLNNPRDAIIAIESKIGTDNSAITTSLDYKMRFHGHTGGTDGVLINLVSAVTGILQGPNGGTGGGTKNWVDDYSNQTINGIKYFY